MIVFDLACRDGHVFEGWFGSTDDYEAQRDRGLVSCPLCGGREVDKAVMAPRVAAKGNRGATAAAAAADMPAPAAVKALLGQLAKAQAKALEGSDYVGPRFADEARAIHLGDVPKRSIHGQATAAEAKSLVDEGVAFSPLPLPLRPPGTDN